MKKTFFAAAIAMVLAACGPGGSGTGSSPSPTPNEPGTGFDVTATDNVHLVTMRVGQKLEVALHASTGLNEWSHPQSNDTSVLAPAVDPAATAARGVTLAAFQAMKPGEANVTANASPKCPPDAACPMYVAVYMLKVTVTP